jgi:hypothetical protein
VTRVATGRVLGNEWNRQPGRAPRDRKCDIAIVAIRWSLRLDAVADSPCLGAARGLRSEGREVVARGEQPRGPAPARALRELSGEAGQEGVHPQGDGRLRPLGVGWRTRSCSAPSWRCSTASTRRISSVSPTGSEPGRSPHDALDPLAAGIERSKVNWVLDADIRDFFGQLDRAWLEQFLEHQIADKRILRLIQKWLAAGVIEEGEWSKTEARDRARSVSFAAALSTSDAARSPAGPGSPAARARGQGATRGSRHTDSLVDPPPRATRHRQPCSPPSPRCRADASTVSSAGRNRRTDADPAAGRVPGCSGLRLVEARDCGPGLHNQRVVSGLTRVAVTRLWCQLGRHLEVSLSSQQGECHTHTYRRTDREVACSQNFREGCDPSHTSNVRGARFSLTSE